MLHQGKASNALEMILGSSSILIRFGSPLVALIFCSASQTYSTLIDLSTQMARISLLNVSSTVSALHRFPLYGTST